jgi:hypothetical protein
VAKFHKSALGGIAHGLPALYVGNVRSLSGRKHKRCFVANCGNALKLFELHVIFVECWIAAQRKILGFSDKQMLHAASSGINLLPLTGASPPVL